MTKSRKILIAVVICLVLILIPLYLNHPSRKYKRAVETFNSQSYEEAQALFEKIPNYKDSGMYLSYMIYLKQYEAGEYEKAESGFASLGDFHDSRKLADECARKQQVQNYEKAKTLFEAQDYKAAASIFSGLGNYEDSGNYAVYCNGMNAFSDGEYRKAQDLFLSVSGFLDADKWAEASSMMEKETIYREALEKFENGEYQTALGLFQQISGYEDATSYIHYTEGLIALNEKKYTAAATAFRSVAGFKDADELTRLSVERQMSQQYQEAVKLFKKGDYKAATTAFSAIMDYADSESYIRYMTAMTDLSEERYKEAIETLRRLGSFLDSKKQAEQAEEQYHTILYNVATSHFEDENYADALEVFSELGEYRDAALYAAYSAGILAEAENDYHSAELNFARISDFMDAGERAEKNHEAFLVQQYALGMGSLEAGDLERARMAFENVKGYLQADEFLAYLDGRAALAVDDFMTAETLFTSLGDFRDSPELAAFCSEKLKPIRYANGIKLLEDGSYEEAAELFERLPGYKDADSYVKYAHILQTAYVGDYRDAIEMLEEMNGFKDTDLLRRYYEGRQAEIDLEYEKAIQLYDGIADFKDSAKRAERLPDMILDRDFDRLAEKLTGRRWWNRALIGEVQEMLVREYQMANTTMPLRFLSLADSMLDEGDFEHSYALTEIVSRQDPDAVDRLDSIQYLYALTEMESGRAGQAEWMLSELADAHYPGAKETLISCWQMLESEARDQGNNELADAYLQKIDSLISLNNEAGNGADESLVEIDPAVYDIPGMDQIRDAASELRDKMHDVIEDAENYTAEDSADVGLLRTAAFAVAAAAGDGMQQSDGPVPDDTHGLTDTAEENAVGVENKETVSAENEANVENTEEITALSSSDVDEKTGSAEEGVPEGELLQESTGDDESAGTVLSETDAVVITETPETPAREADAVSKTVTDEQQDLVEPETVAEDLAAVLESGISVTDVTNEEISSPADENPEKHTDVLGAEAIQVILESENEMDGQDQTEQPSAESEQSGAVTIKPVEEILTESVIIKPVKEIMPEPVTAKPAETTPSEAEPAKTAETERTETEMSEKADEPVSSGEGFN